MLHLQSESRFADVLERALYNGALSGVSLDGERFFYENPLESRGDHHRRDWFGCSCCPPNIARLLASLGGYVYSEALDAIYVHLYISGTARCRLGATGVTVRQESRYPWDGNIRLAVEPDRQATFDLALRIPGWCRTARIRVNGDTIDISGALRGGYAYIRRHWRRGDIVELELDMPIERVYAHPAVRQAAGCVALQRGPIVYCLEGVDNPFPLHRLVLPATPNSRRSLSLSSSTASSPSGERLSSKTRATGKAGSTGQRPLAGGPCRSRPCPTSPGTTESPGRCGCGSVRASTSRNKEFSRWP